MVSRTENNITTTYLPDGNSAWVKDDTTNQTYYTWGSGLEMEYQPGQTPAMMWYHGDSMGNTRLLTDPYGALTGSFSYDAFGNTNIQTGTADTNLKFCGLSGVSTFDGLIGQDFFPKIGRNATIQRPRGYNEYTQMNFSGKDAGHLAMDLAGTVDPTGLVDAAHVWWYTIEGDTESALLTGAGVLPIVGDAAKIGKYFGKGAKILRGGKYIGKGARAISKVDFFVNCLKSTKMHKHHLLPRQFAKEFEEKAMLNVEDYILEIYEFHHTRKPYGIHTGADSWNKQWDRWLKNNKGRIGEDKVFEKLKEMMEEFGLDTYTIIQYYIYNPNPLSRGW